MAKQTTAECPGHESTDGLCYVTKPATWAFPEGWDTRDATVERGDVVELTATLKPGRDPHFAIGKRPTCARLVSRPPAAV